MNKPVAWMYAVNGIWTAFSDELPPDDAYDKGTLTPLYTHPVKELTDEEIFEEMQIWGRKQFGDDYADPDMEDLKLTIGLHKAILRKAQKK